VGVQFLAIRRISRQRTGTLQLMSVGMVIWFNYFFKGGARKFSCKESRELYRGDTDKRRALLNYFLRVPVFMLISYYPFLRLLNPSPVRTRAISASELGSGTVAVLPVTTTLSIANHSSL